MTVKQKPFQPQLACDAKTEKLVFPVYAQLKIDGVRMLVRDTIATGRSMKQYKNKKMTEYFSQPCFEGFDMEIGATHQNDPDLCRLSTSVVNTIKGDLPNFAVVFDYLTEDTINEVYSVRMEALREYLSCTELPDDVQIIFSEQKLINNLEELEEYYAYALENNYEGLIIRGANKHKSGRATVNEGGYLRLKPTGDSEGILLSIEEAMENQNEAKINELGHTERSTHQENLVPKGMIGSMWIKDIHSGQELKIGAGTMTHEQRVHYFNHPEELEDKLLKYKFLATGQKDKPRHARFFSFRAKEDMSK